jgi:hypothetical protein
MTETFPLTSGSTHYACFFQGASVFNATSQSMVAASGATQSQCSIAMSEIGSSGLFYITAAPTGLPAGRYTIILFKEASAGTVAWRTADTKKWVDDTYDWNGSARITLSSSGSGPFACTVTVAASAVAVPGAAVSMADGAIVYTATTNSSGVASFALAASTYTLSVFKAGYSHTPQSVSVSAAGNTAAAISVITVTPATAPTQTTGYLTCYDLNGVAAAGVTILVELLKTASATAGLSYPTDRRTATSGADGLVQFTGLLRLATYRAKRGSVGEKWIQFTTADATTSALPEVLGRDA